MSNTRLRPEFTTSRSSLAEHIGVAPHQIEAVFARFLSDTAADDNHIRTAAVVSFAHLRARRVRVRHGVIQIHRLTLGARSISINENNLSGQTA